MSQKKINYSQKKAELDEIVQWFNRDDIDFEQAQAKYVKAKGIIDELNLYLDNSKKELDILIKKSNK